jgi:hypothetical protein
LAAQYRRVPTSIRLLQHSEARTMLDFYMIALALVSFAALFGYLHLCDWL